MEHLGTYLQRRGLARALVMPPEATGPAVELCRVSPPTTRVARHEDPLFRTAFNLA